jgi:FixJ family two-component response regulator
MLGEASVPSPAQLELGLAESTVKAHRGQVMQKMKAVAAFRTTDT